jgi:hypothetical protein
MPPSQFLRNGDIESMQTITLEEILAITGAVLEVTDPGYKKTHTVQQRSASKNKIIKSLNDKLSNCIQQLQTFLNKKDVREFMHRVLERKQDDIIVTNFREIIMGVIGSAMLYMAWTHTIDPRILDNTTFMLIDEMVHLFVKKNHIYR